MFTVKVQLKSGVVEERQIDKTNEVSARAAAERLPEVTAVISCEKTFAPPKAGAAAPKAVAEACEHLRAVLKATYGGDYSFVVAGKGAVIAASNFDLGTVVAQVLPEQLDMPV